MTEVHSASSKRGVWLVVGILMLMAITLVVSWMMYVPDRTTEFLHQEGMPAARQGMVLAQEGKKLLPPEEQREMDAIYAEAFQALTAEERQRFQSVTQQGARSTDRDIAESATLLEKALRSLPEERGTRLWALVNKAVKLAQEQPAATPATP
ncbi:MAG: hypothetical protein AB7G75_27335 [Candidatus Binatia bacterium]